MIIKKQTEILLNKPRRAISKHIFEIIFPQINNMNLKNIKNGQGSYKTGI